MNAESEVSRGSGAKKVGGDRSKLANELVKACLDSLQEHDVLAWRMNNQPLVGRIGGKPAFYRKHSGPKGLPDIVGVCPNGRAIMVECKSGPTSKLSYEQRAFLTVAYAHNAVVLVVRDVAQLNEVIRWAEERSWDDVDQGDEEWRPRQSITARS